MPQSQNDIVEDNPYTATYTYKAKTGMWPAMRGKIFERDVEIGTFERKGVQDGWIPPLTYKFHSSQARNRFDNFADCLSIAESIECILPDGGCNMEHMPKASK